MVSRPIGQLQSGHSRVRAANAMRETAMMHLTTPQKLCHNGETVPSVELILLFQYLYH